MTWPPPKPRARRLNSDQGLIVTPSTVLYCVPGSLIRTPTSSSVYYCGSDGKRYVFPNARTYATWYKDFSAVQIIHARKTCQHPARRERDLSSRRETGEDQTDPKVYAVRPQRHAPLDGSVRHRREVLRHGQWAKSVEDVPDVFFTDYTVGNSREQIARAFTPSDRRESKTDR